MLKGLCKLGHAISGDNAKTLSNGRVMCRLCSSRRTREWRRNNRERHNLLRKDWTSRNPAAQADMRLRSMYGLSLLEFEEKAKQQKFLCAICGRTEPKKVRLAVDHNHQTGTVRDLLCSRCNPGIGLFDENPELLHKAAEYLLRWKGIAMEKNPYSKITGGDKKPKKEIKHIITSKTHDGKYLHKHVHHHPEHHPDETHVSNDMGDLHAHFDDHAGSPNDGEAVGNAAPMTAEPSAPAMPPQEM